MGHVEIIDHGEAGRRDPLDFRQQVRHAFHDLKRIAIRRGGYGDGDAALARGERLRIVILAAHLHGGDIAQPHQPARAGLEHHLAERIDVAQVRARRDVDRRIGALDLAGRGLHIIRPQRSGNVARGQAPRRQLHRIDPDAHGDRRSAANIGGCHARHAGDERQRHAVDEIDQLRGRLHIADEGNILDGRGAIGNLADDRIGDARRQAIFDLLRLGENLGHRAVGIGVEHQLGGDLAGSLARCRSEIFNAVGRRDRLRDRRGDEALHHILRRAGKRRIDGDRGAFHLGILTDRQAEHRAEADQQNEQADHDGEDRPADENIGKGHVSAPRPAHARRQVRVRLEVRLQAPRCPAPAPSWARSVPAWMARRMAPALILSPARRAARAIALR